MPRKKSVKLAARRFREELENISDFLEATQFSSSTDEYESWIHEYAIIRTYTAFESLILDALVGAINNDTSEASKTLGVTLPKNLTLGVCEYLVTNGGYFDFKGRSGLISVLKKYLPAQHYLVKACSKSTYRTALDQLSALRNFAAHRSAKARDTARQVLSLRRLASAGAWLKRQGRINEILDSLSLLATEIENGAPY